MTSHLNKHGNLTANQKAEARLLDTSQPDFIQVVLQRIADDHENICSEPVTIHCRKPYIIVGHGPGWEKQVEKIRGTKAKIIATDICSTPMIKMGIIPDYIATYEESPKLVSEKMFDFKAIKEHNISVIGSKQSKEFFEKELGKGFRRFTDYNTSHCTNVGIFGSWFAQVELGADKIILIGMNCWSKTEGYPFLNWYVEWRALISHAYDNQFVNCTEGGILYFGRMIFADFATLEIDFY